jgi:hypothetical protein
VVDSPQPDSEPSTAMATLSLSRFPVAVDLDERRIRWLWETARVDHTPNTSTRTTLAVSEPVKGSVPEEAVLPVPASSGS